MNQADLAAPALVRNRLRKTSGIDTVLSAACADELVPNVSATINIQDGDWDRVGKWMWENRSHYNGLACLPADNTSYKQMPFETITEEQYEELSKHLRKINLDDIKELEDFTDQKGELACAGGSCEIV